MYINLYMFFLNSKQMRLFDFAAAGGNDIIAHKVKQFEFTIDDRRLENVLY